MIQIVIPHYIINERIAKLAKGTIKSFRDTCECNIISCDDNSPHDSEFLKDISDVYIRNKINKGFAGNCNVGFKWILDNIKDECDVVCANNDIEVYVNWHKEFIKALDITNARIVGGLGFRFKGFPPDKHNSLSTGGYYNDWMFPGGFFMIKKSVLEDYGLYDESYKHGGYEDIDLFKRWVKGNEKLVITPQVHYWHEEGATRFSKEEKGKQSKAEIENRKYFNKKNNYKEGEFILNFLKDNRINL